MARPLPLPTINTVVDDTVAVINADGSVASFSPGTSASPTVVAGTAAAGAAASGAPVQSGGVVSTTVPTAATSGQMQPVWLNAYGAPIVAGLLNTGTDGVGNTALMNFPTQTASAAPRLLMIANHQFNGTSWDRARKPNVSKRIASSAASGNPDFLKASAGDLTMFWGLNGAAITYVQIYNKASAPTIGTDTPILTYPIAANAAFEVSIPNGGLYFATGIAYAFTTDAAGTTGAAAAAVTACNIIGA